MPDLLRRLSEAALDYVLAPVYARLTKLEERHAQLRSDHDDLNAIVHELYLGQPPVPPATVAAKIATDRTRRY